MNSFLKRLLAFSVGPAGGAAISLITVPLTTYFVSPEEYGKAGMFILFQTLFATFLYLGIDQAYAREYNETDDHEGLFRQSLLIPLAGAVIFFLISCAFLPLVSKLLFGSADYRLPAAMLGIVLVFMVIERFILLSIRMDEKALEYSFFNILIKLIVLAATLFFVLLIRRDFLAVVYSTVLGQAAGDTWLICKYHRLFRFAGFRPDKPLIRRLLTFGVPIMVAASIAAFLNSTGRLALRLWSSFYEIGIFTASMKIAAVLSVVQSGFTNFWVPTAYRWYSQKHPIGNFRLVSDAVLLVMSALFMFVLIFKNLIVFVLSPDYGRSVYLVGFLCLQPVMYTISETTTLGIVFSRKSYLNIWVSLASTIPCLILNALLVPRWGAVGAALSTGAAYLVFFWGRSYFSNLNWTGFPLGRHVLISLILFAAALVNAWPLPYIAALNVGILIVILLMQAGTIRRIFFYLPFGRKKKQTSSS